MYYLFLDEVQNYQLSKKVLIKTKIYYNILIEKKVGFRKWKTK